MALDPQVQALLDEVAASGVPSLETLSVAEAREAIVAMATMQAEAPPLATVANRTIPGAGGEIPVRIYTPHGRPPFPVLVYFHGGGFVLGSLDTHDPTCRSLASGAGSVVVSVDYRLAPENKFPAAAEDAYAATAWVAANAAMLGVETTRLAVGGDSAGGNLAAVAALMARDRGGPEILFQLLVYPVTDARCDTSSYRDNAEGYFLTAAMMRWFWGHYLAGPADGDHPYASPLRAPNLAGVAPALVLTAEFDPLRDEGAAYAARLAGAGVRAEESRYDGMIHGFFGMGSLFAEAETAMAEATSALRDAFARR